MYQEWCEAGQKGTAPSKNILINAIGLLENISPDITLESVSGGDVFLICSDGLSNLIDTENLQECLSRSLQSTPDTVCKELISMANVNGGHDNISVVIINVIGASSTEDKVENKAEDLEKTVQRKSV